MANILKEQGIVDIYDVEVLSSGDVPNIKNTLLFTYNNVNVLFGQIQFFSDGSFQANSGDFENGEDNSVVISELFNGSDILAIWIHCNLHKKDAVLDCDVLYDEFIKSQESTQENFQLIFNWNDEIIY